MYVYMFYVHVVNSVFHLSFAVGDKTILL